MPAEEDEKRHTRQCMLSEMPRLHRTNNNNNNKDTRNSSSVSQSVSQSVSPNSPPAEKKNRHQQQQQPKEHVCAMCLRFIFDCHIEHHIRHYLQGETRISVQSSSPPRQRLYMLFQPSSLNPIQQLPPAIAFNNSTSAEEIDRQAATTTAGKCGGNPRKATIFLCWWRMGV